MRLHPPTGIRKERIAFALMAKGVSGKKYVGGSIDYAREPFRVTASAARTTVDTYRNGNDRYDFYLLGGAYKFSGSPNFSARGPK